MLWPSPRKLFREARRASPQRHTNGARANDGAGLPWLSRKAEACVARKLRRCFGRSPGKLFRDSPQRQNNGVRANDGAGLPWLSRKLRPSPRSCFGKPDAPAPRATITERARTTARVCHGCRGSFGRRAESFLRKPDGPDPSVKTTGTSFRAARRARPKPKPLMILRVAKNGTRRARADLAVDKLLVQCEIGHPQPKSTDLAI